jgi:hypothetical protein
MFSDVLSCNVTINGHIYRTCMERYLTLKEVSCQVYDQLVKVVQDGNMKYASGEMIRYRRRRSGACIWMVGVDMGSQSVLINYVELRETLYTCKGSLFVWIWEREDISHFAQGILFRCIQKQFRTNEEVNGRQRIHCSCEM